MVMIRTLAAADVPFGHLPPPFHLLLFSTDSTMVQQADAAGIDGIIVDWEDRGKDVRQAGADTEINHDTRADLKRVRAISRAPIICRVNATCESTAEEIEAAIACGATEVLLPMVRAASEVDAVIELVGGRCGVGILVETVAAVERARDFGQLPLARVYVGLNDLAIERRSASIFEAITDGTVDRLREIFSVPFGFGGLTLPDRGHPVPCRLLIDEMVGLRCQFSFLRRSFHRDIRGRAVSEGLRLIREALADAHSRLGSQVAHDHDVLKAVVMARV